MNNLSESLNQLFATAGNAAKQLKDAGLIGDNEPKEVPQATNSTAQATSPWLIAGVALGVIALIVVIVRK